MDLKTMVHMILLYYTWCISFNKKPQTNAHMGATFKILEGENPSYRLTIPDYCK